MNNPRQSRQRNKYGQSTKREQEKDFRGERIQSVHARFVVDKVEVEYFFLPALLFVFLTLIPTTLDSHLNLHAAFARTTKWRSLGTLQKRVIFRNSGSTGWKSTFTGNVTKDPQLFSQQNNFYTD
jgi:hypothetical protein